MAGNIGKIFVLLMVWMWVPCALLAMDGDLAEPDVVPIHGDIKLVLTFDDGPHVVRTPKLLSILDQYGVKAIFFVVGERFEGNGERAALGRKVLQETYLRGHLIGNHTVHHPMNLCRKKADEIEQELVHNAALIEGVIGQSPLLFRPPFGLRCLPLEEVIKKQKYLSVLWEIDPLDWKRRDRHENLAALIRGIAKQKKQEKPSVILLHDIHEESVETLPLFLEWVKTQPHVTIVHPFELFKDALLPNESTLEEEKAAE